MIPAEAVDAPIAGSPEGTSPITVVEEIDGESRWEPAPEQWARIEASERSAAAGRTRPLDDVVVDIKAKIAARADSPLTS